MKNISFYKMSGAGNDFILFDRKINPSLKLNPGIIKKLCDRHNGIGADGVVTISDNGKYDFVMEYYNADGSTGSLCGNASRCAIKFAAMTGRLKRNNADFVSNKVAYKGEIIDNSRIKFFFNTIEDLKSDLNISLNGQIINAGYLNTGSPHVVIKIEDIMNTFRDHSVRDINDMPVYEAGREIRYLKDFAPDGTNVNFIQIKNNKVFMRTYERGVENETLACGTGAAACAVIASLKFSMSPPVIIATRGGDELIVDFNSEGGEIRGLSLTGPAKVTFTGVISEEVFS